MKCAIAIGAAWLVALMALPVMATKPMEPTVTQVPSAPIVLKVVKVATKPPFRVRHPRIYKVYRTARTVCIYLEPVLNVGANACTVMYYLRH